MEFTINTNKKNDLINNLINDSINETTNESNNLFIDYKPYKDNLFLNKKKILIKNYELYLNTINHKCITNSCKRRHEEIYGNFIKSINDLEIFKVNVINKK
jgi:hypothetical protein